VHSLSDEVYEGLRRLAASNHRSMQEQVRVLIERELRYAQTSAVTRARDWRARLAGRNFATVVDDIRADRAR
jgi:hypothetical protein